MTIFDKIINRQEKISVIGLGYVGFPIAAAFSEVIDVIGYDISNDKINMYLSGIDPTNEIGSEKLAKCNVLFTSDEEKLKEAIFHIVAVPTPVNDDHTPNLKPLESASRILGRNLRRGSIVVYESTVYPGVTEDVCVPILENESGLKCGEDFKVGYSPERINPGDKLHRLDSIVKVVSGMDEESLEIIAQIYAMVAKAGVYKAESIKVAEAAKVIENSQRDINIAFMNELSIIFHKLGIDTRQVLNAAETKWNFLRFYPGLVGGHCIGVDPYYLTYKAEQLGYHSQIILSGRRINDEIGKYIASQIIKCLIKADIPVKDAKVAILGFTFKENCADTRNTKVIDIINELVEYGISPLITDPVAEANEALREYDIKLFDRSIINNMDAIVLAVAHDEYKTLKFEEIDKMFKEDCNQKRVIIDIKGLLNKEIFESLGNIYWRL